MDTDLGGRLPEKVRLELLDPPVVLLGDAAVPPVAKVELDQYHVTRACCGAVRRAGATLHLGTRVQCLVGIAAVEVDDVAHVVDEGDVDVQAAGDQPGSLEEVLVVFS